MAKTSPQQSSSFPQQPRGQRELPGSGDQIPPTVAQGQGGNPKLPVRPKLPLKGGQQAVSRNASSPKKSGQNPGAVRPRVRSSRGMSIKTKVVIAMAGLAACIVILFFVLVSRITSNAIEETVNQAGVGYTKFVYTIGRQYNDWLSDSMLLAYYASLKESSDVQDKKDRNKIQGLWNDVLKRYGYEVRKSDEYVFHPAHPDGSYLSITEMKADLEWLRVANALEAQKALTENSNHLEKAEALLGPEWKTFQGDKSPSSRKLEKLPLSAQDWPPGNSPLFGFKRIGQDLFGDGPQALYHFTVAGLLQSLKNKEIKRLSKYGLSAHSKAQVAGVSYVPNTEGMAFVQKLSEANFDSNKACQIVVGLENFTPEVKTQTTLGDIQMRKGHSPEVGKVREYAHKSAGGKEEVRIFLNSHAVEEARIKVITWIFVITGVSLVVTLFVAFFVGGNIARPIQSLMQDVNIIATGNFDHRPRIYSKDEVGLLAQLLGEMATNLRLGQELWRQNQSQQHDLNMAKEIQENLLPQHVPKIPGYDASAYYSPSKEVGGDYYDFFLIDKEHIGMICADVSGKGIPGSLVMMMTKTLINYEAQKNLSPKDIFCKVNRIIARDIKRGMFVTAFYMVLDVPRKVLTVSSAGHTPLLLYRASSKKCYEINPGGIALGFDKDGRLFEKNMAEKAIQLESGDRVVIYTDGVTEAMNPQNEEFGEDRLKEITIRCSQMSSNDYLLHLVNAIENHAQTDQQHDDITVVSLRVD